MEATRVPKVNNPSTSLSLRMLQLYYNRCPAICGYSCPCYCCFFSLLLLLLLLLQLLFLFVGVRAVVATVAFTIIVIVCSFIDNLIFIIGYRFDLPKNGVLDCPVLFKTLISSC